MSNVLINVFIPLDEDNHVLDIKDEDAHAFKEMFVCSYVKVNV